MRIPVGKLILFSNLIVECQSKQLFHDCYNSRAFQCSTGRKLWFLTTKYFRGSMSFVYERYRHETRKDQQTLLADKWQSMINEWCVNM